MFDSHVHLDYDPFYENLEETLLRMRAASITGALIPAIDLASSVRALEIAGRNKWVRAALGVHPLYLRGFAAFPEEELRGLAKGGGFSAVGETGLDFWEGRGEEEKQREFFLGQVAIAKEFSLPLLLHSRKSLYETLKAMRGAGFDGPAVVHAFSGGWHEAKAALDKGCHLSACANITRPNKSDLRETLKKVPAERLLIETDAPDMPPWEKRGQLHQPWDLPLTLAALAQIRGETPEETAAYTTRNAEKLFPAGGIS